MNTLIDEKQLQDLSLPKLTRSLSCSIKSGTESKRITAIDKEEQKKAELAKYRLTIQFVWTGIGLNKLIDLASAPQSLVVEIQSYVRKLGDDLIKKYVAGTEEHENGQAVRIKNGTIRVMVVEWLKLERGGVRLTPGEKLARITSDMTVEEKRAFFEVQMALLEIKGTNE